MKIIHILLLFIAVSLFFTSCQKVSLDEDEIKDNRQFTVSFKIKPSETDDSNFPSLNAPSKPSSSLLTRATDIAELCKRINLAVYKDGSRVNQINQTKSDDKNFGNISLKLDSGKYTIVALAHNYTSNPTLTNPEKITFGHDLTDTFIWTEECNLNKDIEISVSMRRAVGMFRLITTDTIPSNVGAIQFYYTGGSSTINALTGLGCVNSKQTSTFLINNDMKGKTATFDIFTFPKEETNSKLNIKITVYDKSDNTMMEKEFIDVPLKRNQITQYTGKLFPGGTVQEEGNFSLHLSTEDEWTISEQTF